MRSTAALRLEMRCRSASFSRFSSPRSFNGSRLTRSNPVWASRSVGATQVPALPFAANGNVTAAKSHPKNTITAR